MCYGLVWVRELLGLVRVLDLFAVVVFYFPYLSLFSFFFCHCIMGFSFFLFFVLWVFASIGDIGFCSF